MRHGGALTFELLEDTLDGARAAAAAHGNVELVCVGHVGGGWWFVVGEDVWRWWWWWWWGRIAVGC